MPDIPAQPDPWNNEYLVLVSTYYTMQAFAQAGIDVYYADRNNLHKVEEAAGGMIERKFPMMRTDQVCQGGGDCQH